MRIDGLWYLCDDGVVRPVFQSEVMTAAGAWVKVPFLVDTGADRTVFSGDVLNTLQLGVMQTADRLVGAGGEIDSIIVETEIRLTQDDSARAVFRGHFAGCANLEALDMSVLGRDILNLFAVIVDRPGDLVCLLSPRHFYEIGTR